MALVGIPQGLYYPFRGGSLFLVGNSATLDATGEKWAGIGRVYWDARPGSSKTIDTTGSSSISVQVGATTFNNASSTLDIGIQGVATGSGPTAEPDGSYVVKATVTTAAPGSPAITVDNGFFTAVPTTGTVTLTHGDLIAVVLDFTNRAGADSVVVPSLSGTYGGGSGPTFPITNANASSAWGATGAGSHPMVAFTASDGTVGTLDGVIPIGHMANITWSDSDNPDERGLIFQVPFDCKVDAFTAFMRTVDATSDFTLSLYSTPESGATVMNAGAATVAVLAEQTGAAASDRIGVWNLASEVSLSKNTDYCVAMKATGAGNIRFTGCTLGTAALRALFPGGTTVRSVTRNGGSGDFASSSTTLMFPLGVRISAVDDGTGSGSGGVTPLGNGLHPIGTGVGA